MNEYLIPQEIKSETYFGKGVFLFDIVFIFFAYLIGSLFEDIVDERIKLFYTLLNVMVAVILTRKSHRNPGKRIFESLAISFIAERDKRYHYRFTDTMPVKEIAYEEEIYK